MDKYGIQDVEDPPGGGNTGIKSQQLEAELEAGNVHITGDFMGLKLVSSHSFHITGD